jgi:transcriptional regulator with XRE-family HTH domain
VDLDDDARTIGRRLLQIRNARGKSLRVIAGLAGISKSRLSQIERGEVALDRRSEILALADALQVAPSELVKLPFPAPGNGNTDTTVKAVRRALTAVDYGGAGGQVLPVEVLRDRLSRLQEMRRGCRFAEAATDLPVLIRDLHTTLATGRDVAELLPLAVYLHTQVTSMWLLDACAPIDLRREVASLARRLAWEHGQGVTLGVAAFATTRLLVSEGQSDLAQAELDAVPVPATTPETAALVGGLMVRHSIVAAAGNRAGDAVAAMNTAAELSIRFGETGENGSLGFAFGPTDVGLYRMTLALEAGEPDRAVRIAKTIQPQRHPFKTRQSAYWMDYGRALAQLRQRHDDAVMALRKAEVMFPVQVQRNPFVREALALLLTRVRRDSPAGRVLRGMAYRSGLSV